MPCDSAAKFSNHTSALLLSIIFALGHQKTLRKQTEMELASFHLHNVSESDVVGIAYHLWSHGGFFIPDYLGLFG